MLRKTNPGYDAVYTCPNADYLGGQRGGLNATGRAGWADSGEVGEGYRYFNWTDRVDTACFEYEWLLRWSACHDLGVSVALLLRPGVAVTFKVNGAIILVLWRSNQCGAFYRGGRLVIKANQVERSDQVTVKGRVLPAISHLPANLTNEISVLM